MNFGQSLNLRLVIITCLTVCNFVLDVLRRGPKHCPAFIRRHLRYVHTSKKQAQEIQTCSSRTATCKLLLFRDMNTIIESRCQLGDIAKKFQDRK